MNNLVPLHRHPVEILKNSYLEKKKANPSYSLTAFARDLDLSVSFLSRLMRGERSVTVNQAIQIGTLLGLSSDQIEDSIEVLVKNAPENSKISKKFISILENKKKKKAPQFVSFFEVERFKAISQWYHLAILNLTLTKNFNPHPVQVAKRLGISRIEAEDAIKRLLTLGLLTKTKSTLKKTHRSLYIKTLKSERAVREFIEQTMQQANKVLKKVEQEDFDLRCMSGVTLPIALSKLPKLKERILKFQIELADLAQSETYDEVYQFNLHLFPLTQFPPTKKGEIS